MSSFVGPYTYLLNSEFKKDSDFKNAIKELEALFENPEYLENVTENSENPSYSEADWNKIFSAVHKLVLYEANKFSNSEESTRSKRTANKYVINTIRYANKFVKRSELFPMVIAILSDNLYEYYHSSYLDIAGNYLSVVEIDVNKLSLKQWKELLQVCLNLYDPSLDSTKKELILKALEESINRACAQTSFILHVKKLLPFVDNAVQDMWLDESVLLKPTLRFAYTVYFQISTEHRNTLCSLGENVLPVIISIDECEEKHKLLSLFMQAYHPNGAKFLDHIDDYDREKWKSNFCKIYQLVKNSLHVEISEIELESEERSSNISTAFVELACEVFNQVLENPAMLEAASVSDGSDFTPSTNEQHLSGAPNLLSIINHCDSKDNSVLVQIVTRLLTKYPNCLKVYEFDRFLHIAKDFFLQCYSFETVSANLCNLGVILIKFEKEHIESIKQSTHLVSYWSQISSTVLRNIDLNITGEGLSFLNYLIANGKIPDATFFISPYINKTIVMSPMNVESLLVFCQYNSIHNFKGKSNDADSIKRKLLEWALNIPWEQLRFFIPIDTLSKLLIRFLLKSHNTEDYEISGIRRLSSITELRHDAIDSPEILSPEVTATCHSSLQFSINLFNRPYETPTEKDRRSNSTSSDVNVDTTFLEETLKRFMTPENREEYVMSNEILKIALLAKIVSDLKDANIISAANVNEFSLTKLIIISLGKIFEKFSEMDLEAIKFSELMLILESLDVLFTRKYFTLSIAQVISSTTTMEAMKRVWNLIGNLSEAFESKYDYAHLEMLDHIYRNRVPQDEPSKKNILKTSAVKVLTSYCCFFGINGALNKDQMNVAVNLLKAKYMTFNNILDLKIALKMLESFTDCEPGKLNGVIVNLLVQLSVQLFKELRLETKISRALLRLMPAIFIHSTRVMASKEWESISHNLSKLFENFFEKFLAQGDFSPLVLLDSINCLSKILAFDSPHFSTLLKDDETRFFFNILPMYLSSPFYSVRLLTARCVNLLFLAEEAANSSWKSSFFKTIINGSWEKQVLEGSERVDEKLTKRASAINMVAAVVCGNDSVMRSEALLALFQMNVKLDKSSALILKVVQDIDLDEKGRWFIGHNLYFLLTSWLNRYSSVTNFPWALLDCSSEQEFYERHGHVLLPLLIRDPRFRDQIPGFCEKTNSTLTRTIEQNFASLMPMFLYPEIIKESDYVSDLFKEAKKNARKYKLLLEENVVPVFATILRKLYDEDHFSRIFSRKNAKFPSKELLDPLQLSSEALRDCLERLKSELNLKNVTLIQHMVTKHPKSMQKVLMDFTYNMKSTALTKEWQLRAFHQYIYFCDMIGEELQRDYFDDMSSYVIRDVSYTLIHMMKKNASESNLAEFSCKYLKMFLKHLLPVRVAQVKEHLNLYVSSLISQLDTPIYRETLKSLVVEEKEILAEAIANLDPFSDRVKNILDIKEFREARLSLELEMERFLRNNVIKDKNEVHHGESLAHLKHQLSSKRSELRALYSRLESSQGFSEDCVKSVLHRLIHRLVKFTESSVSFTRIEAVSCLSLLGPMSLTTLTLYPDKSFVLDVVDSASMLTYHVITLLSNSMIENDLELRKASSDAMYEVFALSPEPWTINISGDDKSLRDFEGCMESKKKTWYRDEFPRIRLDFIWPFTKEMKSLKSGRIGVNRSEFDRVMDVRNDLWTRKSKDSSYPRWIAEVCTSLVGCFENSYLNRLAMTFELNARFCEETLPRIVYLLVRDNTRNLSKLYLVIDCFFRFHIDDQSEKDRLMHETTFMKYESVRCMLNIVNYVRAQAQDNLQMDVDYLKVAQASEYCCAYFTASMYVELWCERFLRLHPIDNELIVNHVHGIDEEKGRIVQELIRNVYINIGFPETIYGCTSLHWVERSSQIQYYMDTKQWDKLIMMHDVALTLGKRSTKELLRALHEANLHNLLQKFSRTATKVHDFEYESAWRLADWEIIPARKKSYFFKDQYLNPAYIDKRHYFLYHHKSLKFLHDSKDEDLAPSLKNARESVVKALRDVSFESSASIYPHLSKLQMLHEIELLSSVKNPEEILKIHGEWKEQASLNNNEFQYIEPIFSQRTVMLQMGRLLDANLAVKEVLAAVFLAFFDVAKQYEQTQTASAVLEMLNVVPGLPDKVKHEILYRRFYVTSVRGDLGMSRLVLSRLLDEKTLETGCRAHCLQLYGTAAAELCLEHPQDLTKKYFQESIKIFNSMGDLGQKDKSNFYEAQASFARFADGQYRKVLEYTESWEFKNAKACIKNQSDQSISQAKTMDMKKAVKIKKVYHRDDKQEMEALENDRTTYLILAVKSYATTAQISDRHNFLLFRLVSLWLKNSEDANLNTLLKNYIHAIPSYKFIPLVPQLAPHMSNDSKAFSRNINAIMTRCALDHPYHAVPVLLALKHLYQDRKYQDTSESASKSVSGPRIEGAEMVINQLKKRIRPIVCETEKLSLALISLAYLQVKVKKGSDHQEIPRNHEIRKIRNIQSALVSTMNIDVKMNAKYEDIVSVREYGKTFDFVGGVNAPKKIACVGSDGITRQQLVKGRDDLRQDAVMQQVFSVINSILRDDETARNRKLHIRTYKVVPLSQRSGVLEWCENTAPIISILVGSDGNSGIHKKYYPKDYSTTECRKKMNRIGNATVEVKYEVYKDICKKVHPAFHHFFMETYQSPEIWFERKLSYTRSVASSSMVGYILGIGDRHLNNILFDKVTAEVVHIDFGIAFEQGKVLPTPEVIPFRLTRDMEAAMGVYGAKGTMKRFCEETLLALRQKTEIIFMLVQVLLYDPLYTWEITPQKMCTFQSEDSSMKNFFNEEEETSREEINKLAEKALWLILQKLQGTEEGVQTNISGQIASLIQQARDPMRLCKIFYGWQPYL